VRNTPEYYAMGVLDQILLQGDDALLRQVLVQQKGLTGGVEGGINDLGNMFNYTGPMLWTVSLYHDNSVSADSIMTVADSVIESMCSKAVDEETMNRARIKFRSRFYDITGEYFGVGRADLLASFALFDDDPGKINTIEEHLKAVTTDLLQKTAREYLRKTNQTVLSIVPKSGS